ncbi:MAG: acylneuraminate cytidylyltransferase family protein [Elusimicrobia bacterium]|nr:acylneuraminate cytidylyltransferase family protein [Elusimicrobiota bacterium]
MKILGLIPARGGSKGIPGKNIKPLGGKPLLAYTLEAARLCGRLDRLLLSTDSPEIAKTAEALGLPVPWLRPAELASDSSHSMDLVLHALKRLDEEGYRPDAVLLLQPTSPFRSADTLRKAIDMLESLRCPAVVSFSPARERPHHFYTLSPDGAISPLLAQSEPTGPRQALPVFYKIDGSIFLNTTESLLRDKVFVPPGTRALISPESERVDLDTMDDWRLAESLLQGCRS